MSCLTVPVDLAPKLFGRKTHSIYSLIALHFLMAKEYPVVQCNWPLSIRHFLILQARTKLAPLQNISVICLEHSKLSLIST